MHEANISTRGWILFGFQAASIDVVLSWDKENPFEAEVIFYGSQEPTQWNLPLNLFLEAVYTGRQARCDDASLQMIPDDILSESIPAQARVGGSAMVLHLEGAHGSDTSDDPIRCANVLLGHNALRVFCDKVNEAITASVQEFAL